MTLGTLAFRREGGCLLRVKVEGVFDFTISKHRLQARIATIRGFLMPVYKTVFYFEGFQANPGRTASSVVSWTETWYQTNTGIDNALAVALRRDNNSFISYRTEMLHALYMMKWVRCSDVDNPKLTKIAPITPAAAGKLGAIPEADGGRIVLAAGRDSTAAQVSCVVEVDFVRLPAGENDVTHHRRSGLRGLPNTLINGNIMRETGGGFQALRSFCDWIARHETGIVNPRFPISLWQIRYERRPIVRSGITALVIHPDNKRQIQLTAPLGALTRGQKVIVQNTTGIKGVNRIWTVLADQANPGPYTLGQSRTDLAGVYSANSGSCHVVRYDYGPCDQYTMIGLRNRKIGSSPFGRTRGRRRVS